LYDVSFFAHLKFAVYDGFICVLSSNVTIVAYILKSYWNDKWRILSPMKWIF